MIIEFDASMFPSSARFFPPGTVASVHAAPGLTEGTGASVLLPCYAEPDSGQGRRGEGHHLPEGSKVWNVYTPSDPGASVDWLCSWDGRSLRVKNRSSDQSSGYGFLWRTECEEVT